MTERVLGPTGSPRRRWTLLLPLIAVLAIGVLYIAGAQAINATGAFELDGNATNDPALAGDDWDNVCHQVVGSDCSTSNDTTGANAVSWIDSNDDPTIFTGGGSKDPDDPEDSWLWKAADTIPDKDTIEHAFAARYSLLADASTCPSPTTTCDVIFFGVDRFDNSGDAQLGFWFFKNAVARTDPPVSSQGGFKFTGHHANGDLLVISDFSNGGGTSTISAYFWDDTCKKAANNNPQANQCGAANLRLKAKSDAANCGATGPTAPFCGIVNAANGTTAPWEFQDKSGNSTYLQGEFYEAGVNLSGLGLGGTCFASFEAESRASTSPTATLKALAIDSFGECTSGLTTTPKPGTTVPIGSNGQAVVHDEATLNVTGANTWTGTLQFFLCGPIATGTCDGSSDADHTGVQVGSDITVTNATSQPISSANATITSAGRYCWRGFFDSNTTGVPDATDATAGECFTVTPLTPTITTQVKLVSDNSDVTNGATIAVGTAVYDTATLSDGTSNAGGTVRYRLYTNNTCATLDMSTAGTAFNAQTDKAVTGGSPAQSDNITLNTPGTFYFQAKYQTGDANNVPGGLSSCSSEVVTVQAQPAVHSTPQVQIRDVFNVTGLSSSPSGNITFAIYAAANCPAGDLLANSTQTFAIGAGPFTTTFVGVPNGDYFFKISYPGDAANAGFSSCVERATVSNITSVP